MDGEGSARDKRNDYVRKAGNGKRLKDSDLENQRHVIWSRDVFFGGSLFGLALLWSGLYVEVESQPARQE